jgi:hypothetical protein
MDSSRSTDSIRTVATTPQTSNPVSPTSATQGLSHPGSFPASESSTASSPVKPPQMVLGKAFEVREFNTDTVFAEHSMPVVKLSEMSTPPMVEEFMSLWKKKGKPNSAKSPVAKKYHTMLTKINHDTGHTLLTWAVSHNKCELVSLLAKCGADIRVCNRFGRTALEEACLYGELESVSLLLDIWPELSTDAYRDYFIAAIKSAAKVDRPMVLAQLLTFFRDEYRFLQCPVSNDEENNPFNPVSSDPLTQQDVYRTFFGGKADSWNLATLMHRTNDNFLLTEEESRMLKLNEIVVFAQQKGVQKIVDIIHAHAKLPPMD